MNRTLTVHQIEKLYEYLLRYHQVDHDRSFVDNVLVLLDELLELKALEDERVSNVEYY